MAVSAPTNPMKAASCQTQTRTTNETQCPYIPILETEPRVLHDTEDCEEGSGG